MNNSEDKKNGEGIQQQPTLISMAQFECSECHNKMMAKVPQMRIMNFPEMSGLLFGHHPTATCPNCGAMFVPLIQGVSERMELKLLWKQVRARDVKQPVTQPQVQTIQKQ